MKTPHNKISQQYIEQWCEERNIKLLDMYQSNKTKHRWLCLVHQEVNNQTFDKVKQANCLKCCSVLKRRKQYEQQAITFAREHNMTLIDEFLGTQKNVRWCCNVHNKVYNKTLHSMLRLKDKRLPCCKEEEGQIVTSNGRRFFTTTEVQYIVAQLGYRLEDEEYQGSIYRHQWYCFKHDKIHITRFHSLYNQQRLLRCCAGEHRRGINHPNYNNNINESQRIKDRRSDKNKIWSRAVRERDNFHCQICGYNQNCIAHHLDSYMAFPEKRYDINNGITLCRKCHSEFHRQYGVKCTTNEQFQQFIGEKICYIK